MASSQAAARGLCALLFVAALGVYVATLNWAPTPGMPTRSLLAHLRLDAAPSGMDPLWGWIVRRLADMPGLSLAGWTGLVSAFCGAACVALLGFLMARVGYRLAADAAPYQQARERQARRLATLVAGFYLACGIPCWAAATCSLPGTFHLLLLLLAAVVFSEFQRTGRRRYLVLLGFAFGIGMPEFPTFMVYFPMALVLVFRELFRKRMLRNWRAYAAFALGLAPGLALYPLHAGALFRQGVALELYASPWQAWAQILQEQFQLIAHAPYRNPVFLVVIFLSVSLWLGMFVLSHRSPWYYEADQMLVRLVFAGALLFALGVVRFLVRKVGLANLMLTPHVLLAACMGYLAGELWILGDVRAVADEDRAKRVVRRIWAGLAGVLPVAVLVLGGLNWIAVDGRYSRVLHAAPGYVLDQLAGRDVVFSTGLLDDPVCLEAWARRAPVRLVRFSQVQSPAYLRRLAGQFAEAPLREPLRQGNFELFLDNLLLSPDGPVRCAVIDMPDVFREFGYLAPDGLLYRLEAAADRVELAALAAAQRPFWAWMERMKAQPIPAQNMHRPYQDQLLLLASKVANNLGVMQAERGDEPGALETWRTARRICPDNLSVLLNLLELARRRPLPEQADLDSAWDLLQDAPGAERWGLAMRSGYVWNAREWMRRGRIWALSGLPLAAEAARRQHSPAAEVDEARAQLLDQAALEWGNPAPAEYALRVTLMKDENDGAALVGLARLALRRNDPAMAEAYLAEALRVGQAENDLRFERAMVAFVRGDKDQALAAFETQARQKPNDPRPWAALAFLSDRAQPIRAEAIKVLQALPEPTVEVRLALAWIYLTRLEWAAAQAQLEKALWMDSRKTLAWELLATLAQIRGDEKLKEAGLNGLRAQAPRHALLQVQQALALFRRNAPAEAEALLRPGLRRDRHPELLHALAYIVMAVAGDRREVRAWLDEAVRKQPFNPMFHGTRGRLNLLDGRLAEAQADLEMAAAALPRVGPLRLMLVQVLVARGRPAAALRLAQALAGDPANLNPAERAELDQLIARCRGHE